MAAMAKAEAGKMAEKIRKTYISKDMVVTRGEVKKIIEHILITFSYPNLLLSLVASRTLNDKGMRRARIKRELVLLVI